MTNMRKREKGEKLKVKNEKLKTRNQ
jgi:hypothetical protein